MLVHHLQAVFDRPVGNMDNDFSEKSEFLTESRISCGINDISAHMESNTLQNFTSFAKKSRIFSPIAFHFRSMVAIAISSVLRIHWFSGNDIIAALRRKQENLCFLGEFSIIRVWTSLEPPV